MHDRTLKNLSAQAYERIRSMIAEGRLPSSVVIREVDLVRLHGMTRSPVREALQRLHADGLIRQVWGGYVALELDPAELTNIYQVRAVLVGLAAELAAQNRTRVDLAHLQDTLEAIDSACQRGADEEADNLVRAFYHALAAASGNEYLSATLGRVTDLFRYKALAVTHPEWRDLIRGDHLLLVDAIKKGNVEKAGRIARELIAKSLSIRIQSLSCRQVPSVGQAGA